MSFICIIFALFMCKLIGSAVRGFQIKLRNVWFIWALITCTLIDIVFGLSSIDSYTDIVNFYSVDKNYIANILLIMPYVYEYTQITIWAIVTAFQIYDISSSWSLYEHGVKFKYFGVNIFICILLAVNFVCMMLCLKPFFESR